MNNSKIAFENIDEMTNEDKVSFLERQKGELSQIVEVISRIEATDDWQKLKRLVLDGVIATLDRQLASEASKQEVNTPELYRLQGQLVWAKKYADLKKLSDFFRKHIENINIQLKNEQKKSSDGAL